MGAGPTSILRVPYPRPCQPTRKVTVRRRLRFGDRHRLLLGSRPGDYRQFPGVGYPTVGLLGTRLHFYVSGQVPCFAGLEGSDRFGPELPDITPQGVDIDLTDPDRPEPSAAGLVGEVGIGVGGADEAAASRKVLAAASIAGSIVVDAP